MPVTRTLLLAVPVVLLAGLVTASHQNPATPGGSGTTPPQPAPATGVLEVEAKCLDNSTLTLKLLDEKLELITKYGVLQITVADVQKIDFAHRCPTEDAE